MGTRHKTKPNQNPPAAARADEPFLRMDPDYPVKPWINRATGERFQTISLQQDDGSFIATIAENPEFRFTAKTRREAEQGLLRDYAQGAPETRTEAEEDEEDLRVVRQRERGRFYSLPDFLKRHGR